MPDFFLEWGARRIYGKGELGRAACKIVVERGYTGLDTFVWSIGASILFWLVDKIEPNKLVVFCHQFYSAQGRLVVGFCRCLHGISMYPIFGGKHFVQFIRILSGN